MTMAPPVRLTYVDASIAEGYTIWKDAKGRKYRLNYPEQLELREFKGKGYSIENNYLENQRIMIITRTLFNKYLVDAKPAPRPRKRTVAIPGTKQLYDEYYIDRTYPTPNALLQATRRALIKVVGHAEELDAPAVDTRHGGFHPNMTVRQAILKHGKYSQDATAGTIIDVNMHSHIYIAERH